MWPRQALFDACQEQAGDVDWHAFFSALYRVGYDYVCCVEHEDRQWEGSAELVKRGFLLARDQLEPYLH